MVCNTRQSQKYRIGGYQAGRKPENIKYHHQGRFETDQLPPKVDLRKHLTEVEEQVGNSCVANAFVGAYEYLAKRDLGESGNVSRLFVYYNSRSRDGGAYEDGGSKMYCAIDSLIEYGACCEDVWPNDETLICEEPDEAAYENAANFKIAEAEYIETDLTLWRHTLAEGYPIAFALNTFESFDEANRNRGRVPQPKRSDQVRDVHGWHAMLCVGYSDKDRMFIVRNSWGATWGDRGYCYIPYDYVIHSDYNAHDSWIIKAVSDLDFSADIWEEDESVFADEGSLLLYDFYVRTSDPEEFVASLDELCQNYIESEEDYYFDYEYEEESDDYYVYINNFDLTIDDPEEFLGELDALCENYAIEEDYGYSLDSETSEDNEEDYDDEQEDYDYSLDSEADEEEEEYDDQECESNEEDEEYCDEEYESNEEEDEEYDDEED